MENRTTPQFFDEHQWETVRAASARVIPTDHDPGAEEAQVVVFIDRYLSGIDHVYANAWGSGFVRLEGKQAQAWSQRIAGLQARYREGLRDLDRRAKDTFGRLFVNLTAEEQDETLGALAPQGGEPDAESRREDLGAFGLKVAMSQPVTDESLGFFETLVLHTRCGFYADPAYGGNKDKVGWRTIGWPGPETLAETNDGRYSTLEHMTAGDYESLWASLTGEGGTMQHDARVPEPASSRTDGPATLAQASVSMQAAQDLLAAGLREARQMGVAASITVVDHAGNLVAFARMDGAPLLSVQISQDKAYTVSAFSGVPTHQWWSMIGERPDLAHGLGQMDRFSVMGGGVPLTYHGQRIGALGVSGGSAEQDQQIAERAAGTLS